MPTDYQTVTPDIIAVWLQRGIFNVHDNGNGIVITKGGRELTQRWQARKGCLHEGDLRVDLRYKNMRRSINVSHLVWMSRTHQAVPPGWEIHHRDENPKNNSFENLICLHPLDHQKFHTEEIPF